MLISKILDVGGTQSAAALQLQSSESRCDLYAQVPLLAITELRDIGMITVTIDTLRKDAIKIPIFACVKYMHG